jgi:hypothetical protein
VSIPGHNGGFNPYRDEHGRWTTPGAGGGAAINAALRQAAGRGLAGEPDAPRSYREHVPAAAAALRTFEDRTRYNPSESGLIIAADGTVILEKNGTRNQVKFTQGQAGKMRGAILSHNHPAYLGIGDTAFSGADISLAISTGLSEIRAVGARFNHVAQMRKPGTQEPATYGEHVLFEVQYDEAERVAELHAQRKVRGLSDAEKVARGEQAIHEQNLAWAREHGYVYYRENLETGEVEGYGHE